MTLHGQCESALDIPEQWRARAAELRAKAEVHDGLAANAREEARRYEGMALRFEGERDQWT